MLNWWESVLLGIVAGSVGSGDVLSTFSDNAGSRAAHYLAAVGEGSWDGEAVFFADVDDAFAYLTGELREGDRVLVKSSNAAGLRHLGDRLGESFS